MAKWLRALAGDLVCSRLAARMQKYKKMRTFLSVGPLAVRRGESATKFLCVQTSSGKLVATVHYPARPRLASRK